MSKIRPDPWQKLPQLTPPKVTKAVKQPIDEIPGFRSDFATVDIPNYGGIGAKDTQDTGQIPIRLLELAVNELKKIEDTFLNYGLIVIQLDSDASKDNPFYIQREDGWTLIAPDVKTREEGMIQLIQALNSLDRELLNKYKLRTYKL